MRLSLRLCLLVPLSVLVSLLAPLPAAVAVGVAAPQVQVTSPNDGVTVEGQTLVGVTGSVDAASSDAPQHFQLWVDGLKYGAADPCPPGSQQCTGSLTWYATGDPGTHNLFVTMTTVNGVVAQSSTITVTEVDTPPSITIDTPAAGATVAGQDIEVTATGTIDPVENDYPLYASLLVDNVDVDDEWCDQSNTLNAPCPVNFDWNTTDIPLGDHTLRAVFRTELGAAASSVIRHVTLVTPPIPTVTILSPSAGASVDGDVPVLISASVDTSTGDAPEELALIVDHEQIDQVSCSSTSATCTATLHWDSNDWTGSPTLQALVYTHQSSAVSAAVGVTISRSAGVTPYATVLTPANNAVVRGVVAVTAEGRFPELARSDSARALQLVVDGAAVGQPQNCPAGSYYVCNATLRWDTAGLTGAHNVQVRFDTQLTSVLSPVRRLVVGHPLTEPGWVRFGMSGGWEAGRYTAGGVVYTRDRDVVPGAKVTVTFTSSLGRVRTVTVTTGQDGRWRASVPAVDVKGTVRAHLGAAYGNATGSAKIYVYTKIRCSVPLTIKHGVATRVSCAVPRQPDGTAVTLRYRTTKSHVFGVAKASKGRATFTFVVPQPIRSLVIWATTDEGKQFSASFSPRKPSRVV